MRRACGCGAVPSCNTMRGQHPCRSARAPRRLPRSRGRCRGARPQPQARPGVREGAAGGWLLWPCAVATQPQSSCCHGQKQRPQAAARRPFAQATHPAKEPMPAPAPMHPACAPPPGAAPCASCSRACRPCGPAKRGPGCGACEEGQGAMHTHVSVPHTPQAAAQWWVSPVRAPRRRPQSRITPQPRPMPTCLQAGLVHSPWVGRLAVVQLSAAGGREGLSALTADGAAKHTAAELTPSHTRVCTLTTPTPTHSALTCAAPPP